MWTRVGWFVKIAMGVLCLLWIIPTLGLLITSFRPPEDANTSGWWTVFGSRFKATQWTLQNYNDVLFGSATNQTPMGNSFVNSLAVALPATIIPIMIAAFAAYAFTFMEFRGRDTLFIVVVGLWWSPTKSPWCPCSSATTTSE
jgi:alpha-glucoside transport system permease protein